MTKFVYIYRGGSGNMGANLIDGGAVKVSKVMPMPAA